MTAIFHLDSENRHALLKRADPRLVKNICECALNVLCGNISLSETQKKKLRKHANALRHLAAPGKSLKTKKKFIVQRGGGLLLPLLAPIIGNLIASLLSK